MFSHCVIIIIFPANHRIKIIKLTVHISNAFICNYGVVLRILRIISIWLDWTSEWYGTGLRLMWENIEIYHTCDDEHGNVPQNGHADHEKITSLQTNTPYENRVGLDICTGISQGCILSNSEVLHQSIFLILILITTRKEKKNENSNFRDHSMALFLFIVIIVHAYNITLHSKDLQSSSSHQLVSIYWLCYLIKDQSGHLLLLETYWN